MELTGRIITVMEAKNGTSVKTGNSWMIQEYVIFPVSDEEDTGVLPF